MKYLVATILEQLRGNRQRPGGINLAGSSLSARGGHPGDDRPSLPLGAQEKPPFAEERPAQRVYHAVRSSVSAQVDGKLDDACWTQGEWTGDFIQRDRTRASRVAAHAAQDPLRRQIRLRGHPAYDTELATQPRCGASATNSPATSSA